MCLICIFLSGVYSGPNPSPGLGTCRSIRQGFPDAHIVAIDYSTRSTGLHWAEFDEVEVLGSWQAMDLTWLRNHLEQRVGTDCIWISGLDIETRWLSTCRFPRGFLVPPFAALLRSQKPEVSITSGLFSVPPHLSAFAPEEELFLFCRNHDWNVWVKGPHYEARRAHSWQDFTRQRDALSSTWSTPGLFVQAGILGYEESIAFASLEGRLLDAVSMRKTELTIEGKTWAGSVSPLEPQMYSALQMLVREARWSGGGELELVRDLQGVPWILECNPRFPAWIHGASLAGHNLPAELVSAAVTRPYELPLPPQSNGFARVVVEIPLRRGFESTYPVTPSRSQSTGVKHPSGMPALSQRLPHLTAGPQLEHYALHAAPETQLLADLTAALAHLDSTPARVFLPRQAERRFRNARQFRKSLEETLACNVTLAYSMKTNPSAAALAVVDGSGLSVETISYEEARVALTHGFSPERVILNGPGKGPRGDCPQLHAYFCDSLEELESTALHRDLPAGTIGLRLRPAGTRSRFGISFDDFQDFRRVANLMIPLREMGADLGLHIHVASDTIGIQQWLRILESTIRTAAGLESASQTPIKCLDLGGGWLPSDFDNGDLLSSLAQQLVAAQTCLPSLSEIILEPGKGLVQDLFALFTRIVEVRQLGSERSIVVDASVADLNQVQLHPHRVLLRSPSTAEWRALRRGTDTILGRICMEHDILSSGLSLPRDIKVGDVVAFLDAGAYDMSMAHPFGKGILHD